MNKIWWLATLLPAGHIGLIYNSLKQTIQTSAPTTYHSHVEQTTYGDDSDANTDFDKVKWNNVNFEQTFKKIYLSNNQEYIGANKVLTSLKQTNIVTDNHDSGTCGGSYKWDLETRIHDWTNDYHDNLYLHSSTAPLFGYSKQNLYLKQKQLLNQKQSYKQLTCPTKFGKLYEHASDIELSIGFHRNFTSGKWNVYGLDKAWIKETARIDVFYNWVDRYLWTLNAGNTPHSNNTPCPSEEYSPIRIDEGGIDVGSYNIDHLLEIRCANWKNKSLKLNINKEFINFAKEWHDSIKNIPINEWTESQKQLFNKYKFNSNDDPWSILNEIKSSLNFVIEYQISDPMEINKFKTEKIQINYDSLFNGIEVRLNKNQDDRYLIKFINISIPETSQPDLYIQKCSTQTLQLNDEQIKIDDNGFYELSKPRIKTISFRNINNEKFKNKYPSSISDIEILQNFITLTDNYGIVDDYSLLTNEIYDIVRDDINGKLTINIHFGEFNLSKTFDCFKKIDNNSCDLDASKVAYNITAKELDRFKIIDIFATNGYSDSVMKDSGFEITNIDNINGQAQVLITSGQLNNKIYTIKNLQPYFIDVKKNINNKFLRIKPSSINIDKLKKNYLTISDEFWSRNQNSLNFKLDSDNDKKVLLIHISYYENINHKFEKLELKINFLSSKHINSFIWLGVSLSGILIISTGLYFWKKSKNRKCVSLN